VVHAVVNDHAGERSYEELWAANERLRGENQELWQAWAEAEELSEAKQRELASVGSAMGFRLTQRVTLLAIVLPLRMVPSRATVGAGCTRALSNRAASWRCWIGRASAGYWCGVWMQSFFIVSRL
jgi:hypothetical protein